MWTLIFLPFLIQAIAIGLDEVVFHLKRGLPQWERLGHPLDTLSVLACVLFALYIPYSPAMIKWYVALALLSCLMVTKDEFVHKHHCPAAEQWLHAILFINHSILLIAMGCMWPKLHGVDSPSWLPSSPIFAPFLKVQATLIFAFFLYQIIYWNLIWPHPKGLENRFLTASPAAEFETRLHRPTYLKLGSFGAGKAWLKFKVSHSDPFTGWVQRAPPMPNSQFSSPFGCINNAFYDELGEKWDTALNHPVALLRAENRLRNPWIASYLEPGSKVLDVGCGAGFLAHELAARGHHVHGVDLSEESLGRARAKDPTGKIQYQRANATALPFEEAQFDAVTAMDLLEHVEDPKAVIQEASRVLKPGGLFFFHTFNRNFWSWLIVIKGVEWCVKNTPKNMHVYPLFIKPSELEEWCHLSDLQVESFKGVRPKISTAFGKMLLTREVPSNLEFVFTHSLRTGYSGFAKKNTS